jgi:hypothetical protein
MVLCLCGYVHISGTTCRQCYHIMDVIAPTDCEIFWWESFHHLFGRDVEYTQKNLHKKQSWYSFHISSETYQCECLQEL